MEWISIHRRKLLVLEVISALCAAAMLLFVRFGGDSQVEPAHLGFIVLPWLVGFVVGLPLVYLSWFGRPVSFVLVRGLQKIFFWVFAAAGLVILGGIYGRFVFGVL